MYLSLVTNTNKQENIEKTKQTHNRECSFAAKRMRPGRGGLLLVRWLEMVANNVGANADRVFWMQQFKWVLIEFFGCVLCLCCCLYCWMIYVVVSSAKTARAHRNTTTGQTHTHTHVTHTRASCKQVSRCRPKASTHGRAHANSFSMVWARASVRA